LFFPYFLCCSRFFYAAQLFLHSHALLSIVPFFRILAAGLLFQIGLFNSPWPACTV
jgi:hypothetical protein